MTSKQREPALPQMKAMLGRAAANRIAREGSPARRPRRSRVRRAPVRVRLLATLGALVLGAAAAVGAGALNRTPVAPQLSPEKSGVKPEVVPGETQILRGPNGEEIEAGVSPCIKSDPAGYSDAELSEPEWCFHAPGEGMAGRAGAQPRRSSGGKAGVYRIWRLPSGKVRFRRLSGK